MTDIETVQGRNAADNLDQDVLRNVKEPLRPSERDDVGGIRDQPGGARLPEQSPLKKVPKTEDTGADKDLDGPTAGGGASQTLIPEPSEYGLANLVDATGGEAPGAAAGVQDVGPEEVAKTAEKAATGDKGLTVDVPEGETPAAAERVSGAAVPSPAGASAESQAATEAGASQA